MGKENEDPHRQNIAGGAPRPSVVPTNAPRPSNAVTPQPGHSYAVSYAAPRGSEAGPGQRKATRLINPPPESIAAKRLSNDSQRPSSPVKGRRNPSSSSVTPSTGKRPSIAPSTRSRRPSIAPSTRSRRPSIAPSTRSQRPSIALSKSPRPSIVSQSPSIQSKQPKKPPIAKKTPKKKQDKNITKKSSYAIVKGFHPLWKLMTYLCRFPFQYTKSPDGGFRFLYIPKEKRAYLFNAINYMLTGVLTLVLLNLMAILTNFPKQYAKEIEGTTLNNTKFKTPEQLRAEELYLFHRNIIPALLIVTELLQAVVGGWNIHLRRELAASYMSLWSEAVETLQINAAVGIKKQMYWVCGIHLAFWVVLVICGLTGFIPVSTGYPSMFAVLLFRIFVPHVHSWKYLWILRAFAFLLLIFIISCAKVYTFFFYFHCRMLKTSFKVWNLRLDRVLHGGEAGNSKAARSINRTTFDQLFRDHICLLDLLGGADELHGNHIMMYYGTQLIALCFESYYFVRSQAGLEEFQSGLRQLDGIAVALYFCQTIFLLYFVTVGAANVGEEFSDGLEVVRSKGMLGDKDNDELYFMLSMYMSFSGYPDTAMTAGKYFVVDKAFVVTMAAVVFSYFVILIQFTPALRYQGPQRRFLTTEIVDSILEIFEQTPPGIGRNNSV